MEVPTVKCLLDADGNLAGPRKRRSTAERDVIGEEHSSAKSEMHANVIAEYHTVKGWRGWMYYPETWTSATEAERRDMICGIAFYDMHLLDAKENSSNNGKTVQDQGRRIDSLHAGHRGGRLRSRLPHQSYPAKILPHHSAAVAGIMLPILRSRGSSVIICNYLVPNRCRCRTARHTTGGLSDGLGRRHTAKSAL